MVIYFLFFLSIILFGLSKIPYKNYFIFFIIFLFSALRFDVGYDYVAYYNVITGLDTINYFRFGLIDQLVIDISRNLDFYQFYFIATSFITIYLVSKTLENYSENYFFSILIFISIPIFYFMSFTIIRQYVAIAIVFFSLKYIFQRSFIKYLFFIFLASVFHLTALVALPIYFLSMVKFSRAFALLLVFLSLFLSPLISNVLESLFPYYFSYITNDASYGKSFLYFLLLIFLLLITHYRYIKRKESLFYFNIFTIGMCLYIVGIQLGEVAPRISYYYLIFLIFLIPSVLQNYKNKQAYLMVLCATTLLYGFNFYLFDKNKNKNAYVPYNTFLNINEKNYEWR